MAHRESGKEELGQDFFQAIIGREAYEFFILSGVKHQKATSPEGATRYGGVKYIQSGFGDGAFGGVIDAGWER